MFKSLRKNYSTPLLASLAIIGLYLAHFIVLGDQTYVLIHDNLDITVTFYKILKDEQIFFAGSSDILQTIGSQIPRGVLPTQFSLISLLFFVFSDFWAYTINSFLIHILSFFSMKYFLTHLKDENSENENLLINVASLSFGLLPFLPAAGGTIALLPLVFHSIMSFYKKNNMFKDWLILVLVPFYSSLYLASMFVLLFQAALIVYYFIRNKKIHWYIFIVFVLQVLIYAGIEYRLIWNVLAKTFISQRTEMIREALSFSQTMQKWWRLFVFGHYHSPSIHTYVILPAATLTVFYGLIKNWRSKTFTMLKYLVLASIILSFTSAILSWKEIAFFISKIPVVNLLKISRVYFFLPFVWSLIFFNLLKIFYKSSRNFFFLIVFIQLNVLFYHSHFLKNYFTIKLNYRDFFARQELAQLTKGYVIDTDAKFMSIGFHPSTLSYNGFKTLDFYLPHYPLVYKKKFFSFIKDELSLEPKLENYFQNVGIRLYFFSHEIGLINSSRPMICRTSTIAKPIFDLKAIAAAEGRYFISNCQVREWKPLSQVGSRGYGNLYLYDIEKLHE
jgi:hypothetical protein